MKVKYQRVRAGTMEFEVGYYEDIIDSITLWVGAHPFHIKEEDWEVLGVQVSRGKFKDLETYVADELDEMGLLTH